MRQPQSPLAELRGRPRTVALAAALAAMAAVPVASMATATTPTSLTTASATMAPAAVPKASSPCTAASPGTPSSTPDSASAHEQGLLGIYKKLYDPKHGYFSKLGASYRSLQTLFVEAPDHGHRARSTAGRRPPGRRCR